MKALLAVAMVVVVGSARAEAGYVQTTTDVLPATAGMDIPGAATLNAAGECVYNVSATDDVIVTYWFDAPACRATVKSVAESGARTGEEEPPFVGPFDLFDPDPTVPAPEKIKRRGKILWDPSGGVGGPPNSFAGARSISCPRVEWKMRERALLVHWYAPHNHWHNMFHAEARSRYWQNLYSRVVGDIHAYYAPRDWGAYSISSNSAGQGWQFWYFTDLAVVENGPAAIASRGGVVSRTGGWFGGNYTALLKATAASSSGNYSRGYCSIGGANLDPRKAPYEVRCIPYLKAWYQEGCYY